MSFSLIAPKVTLVSTLVLILFPVLVFSNNNAANLDMVYSGNSECKEYIFETIKRISEFYDHDIHMTQTTLEGTLEVKADPTNYYWPGLGKVNLIERLSCLKEQKTRDIADFKKNNVCPSNEELIMEQAIQMAIAYYTDGWSLILPPAWTHVDVGELFKGNVLGGENSMPNEAKREIYNVLGMGENHTIRQVLDNPLQPNKWGVKLDAPKIEIPKLPKVRIELPPIPNPLDW
ncbi:hypothetical protein FVB32_05450 [Flagellimonas hymeniacidonis]|uniref:Uncharacterized protein n=1 Tax=Flagellimonas hymeniacidonis TaxID=2603628 RepID=A0A5C8V746_9FLAO|nr:hypothetical protein [Flagellimonas hymeniacidonis]TXN37735.1 hypothetical protein FVB32_05450 [Flagellimonas hymeniacidonis]